MLKKQNNTLTERGGVMITIQEPRQHIVLHDISWETYETLLRETNGSRLRVTYDDGDLEIMTLSFGHENMGVGSADWSSFSPSN
jgi:Uma2 family endonuclease